ncbi:hypothetical protein ACFW3D_13165 [Streptomyces sp. NPDC058864]
MSSTRRSSRRAAWRTPGPGHARCPSSGWPGW